jgi:predicted DNA-binding transcriptional regulator AlpA
MVTYSSRQAALKLGLPVSTLSKYIVQKKIPIPKSVTTGDITVYLWTDAEIEQVRKLLPKIANGRKTRYQKLREKQKAPARVPVPHHKKKRTKKKK